MMKDKIANETKNALPSLSWVRKDKEKSNTNVTKSEEVNESSNEENKQVNLKPSNKAIKLINKHERKKSSLSKRIKAELQAVKQRIKKRYSFEIYEDLELLMNEIQFERFKITGKKPTISEIINNALEEHLPKYLQELKDYSNETN